jgi:hypothetical protein
VREVRGGEGSVGDVPLSGLLQALLVSAVDGCFPEITSLRETLHADLKPPLQLLPQLIGPPHNPQLSFLSQPSHFLSPNGHQLFELRTHRIRRKLLHRIHFGCGELLEGLWIFRYAGEGGRERERQPDAHQPPVGDRLASDCVDSPAQRLGSSAPAARDGVAASPSALRTWRRSS